MKLDIDMIAKIVGPKREWGIVPEYCFRHAVMRALRGEDLKLEVAEGYGPASCDDCRAESNDR
jgi:hypothetical protein